MEWAYTLAYRLSGEHFLAEEISQEAFIALYQSIGRFRQESTLKTYITRIILNLWRQHLRKRYREKRFTEVLQGKMKGGNNLMDKIEDDDLKARIDCAIATLPPKQKEIFILKHLEGLKISEVAEIVGCREGTVKAHLFKALMNLRKQLK
jgi:RNA polymerase sigma-70 factor (ECF subfamily)